MSDEKDYAWADEAGAAVTEAIARHDRTEQRQVRTDHQISEVEAREYPRNVRPALVDRGVVAVFEAFERDSWRDASVREIVGVVLAAVVDARL